MFIQTYPVHNSKTLLFSLLFSQLMSLISQSTVNVCHGSKHQIIKKNPSICKAYRNMDYIHVKNTFDRMDLTTFWFALWWYIENLTCRIVLFRLLSVKQITFR